MSDYKTDRKWSDRFMPQIKQLLGLHLICEAPAEEDEQRNTDLMMLRLDSVRIGCRVRRYPKKPAYFGEFTIRWSRSSGVNTELIKIVNGFGDLFFYGFTDKEETQLCQWFIGDLAKFRHWYQAYVKTNGSHPGKPQPNWDGSSDFKVFELSQMPEGFVVASSFPVLRIASAEDESAPIEVVTAEEDDPSWWDIGSPELAASG